MPAVAWWPSGGVGRVVVEQRDGGGQVNTCNTRRSPTSQTQHDKSWVQSRAVMRHDRLTNGNMETKLIFDATKPLPPYEFPKVAKAPVEAFNKLDLKKTTRTYDSGEDESLW